MNVVKMSAKTKEEAKDLVLKELKAQENEVSLSYKEVKGGLFKGTTYECEGILKEDVINAAQDFLKNVLEAMGIDVTFEVAKVENTYTIKIYSSDNPLIIGHAGQNLEALSVITVQYVKTICNDMPRIILDVEDYKDRQIKRIERLAKNLAREVLKTKVDVEMDNMNSYERRAVHNILTDYKNIETESVGEEPNRHVVIKYKG